MNRDSHAPLMLILSSRSPVGRLTVDLQSFLRFSADMDRHLLELEHRWSHFRRPVERRQRARRRGDWVR